ncbi:transcriptional regulator, TetR family [Fibrisoma limi BUZ 3]|uniref:Transcriptional regulator, TetR family n=2 Tax=Fibrisoma limi TaxID=663275 RepID=I2GRI3_9BACT|nr:transcriptional regulator, TetR family [Fibrisoma limi BUZ 3]
MKRDMNCPPFQKTEEKIKEAAKKVFLEKGFDGATSRDIAEAAGINIALTNYYFRSKEKLFMNIFEDMIQLFFEGSVQILNKPISLRDKIVELIEHDFELMKKNPNLVIFIMNEVHRNPERLVKAIGYIKQLHHTLFKVQVQEAIDKGEIRPVNSLNLMTMIVASVQFLFVSKPMHMQIWQMSEAEFDQFTINQKRLIIDMVTSYLFETEKA